RSIFLALRGLVGGPVPETEADGDGAGLARHDQFAGAVAHAADLAATGEPVALERDHLEGDLAPGRRLEGDRFIGRDHDRERRCGDGGAAVVARRWRRALPAGDDPRRKLVTVRRSAHYPNRVDKPVDGDRR